MQFIIYHRGINSDNVDLKPSLIDRLFVENIRRMAGRLNLPDVTLGIVDLFVDISKSPGRVVEVSKMRGNHQKKKEKELGYINLLFDRKDKKNTPENSPVHIRPNFMASLERRCIRVLAGSLPATNSHPGQS